MEDPSTRSTDPAPSEHVTMSDINASLQHPYTLLPLHFFAPPSQLGDGMTGWRCTSCGRLNVQRNWCVQRCGSCSVSLAPGFPLSRPCTCQNVLRRVDGRTVYGRHPTIWRPLPSRMSVSSAARIPSPFPGTGTGSLSSSRHRRHPRGCADSHTKSAMRSSFITCSLVTTPWCRHSPPSSFTICKQRWSWRPNPLSRLREVRHQSLTVRSSGMHPR